MSIHIVSKMLSKLLNTHPLLGRSMQSIIRSAFFLASCSKHQYFAPFEEVSSEFVQLRQVHGSLNGFLRFFAQVPQTNALSLAGRNGGWGGAKGSMSSLWEKNCLCKSPKALERPWKPGILKPFWGPSKTSAFGG